MGRAVATGRSVAVGRGVVAGRGQIFPEPVWDADDQPAVRVAIMLFETNRITAMSSWLNTVIRLR